jgi:hypothetical protein
MDKPTFNPIVYTKESIIRFFRGFNKAACDGFFVDGKESSLGVRYDRFGPLVLETSGQVLYQILTE